MMLSVGIAMDVSEGLKAGFVGDGQSYSAEESGEERLGLWFVGVERSAVTKRDNGSFFDLN